jgi:ABC-type amino acid transport system permease subunit
MSNSFSGRLLASVYLEIVRNTPLLVQMFVFYFVLGPILDINRFWVGVLCISLFEGSFASEIIRAGILSVAKGQWEASYSVGLTKTDAYRVVVCGPSGSGKSTLIRCLNRTGEEISQCTFRRTATTRRHCPFALYGTTHHAVR